MYLRQTAQLEELENAKIELHRKQHAERLSRIMNEKQRQIGFDYEFLQKQIDEKKAREAAEKAEEEQYQKRFLEEQRILSRMAKQQERTRAQIREETNEFNRTELIPEKRREYDIEHPESCHDEDDPWLKTNVTLNFQGQDNESEDRKRRQIEQLKRWQEQQIAEANNKKALEIEEDRKWQRRYLQNDALMQATAARNEELRQRWREQIAEENKELARQKAERERQEKQRELEMDQKQREYLLNSPFMTEQSDLPSGAKDNSAYKGMSDEQKLEIMNEVREQKLAADRRRQEEAERERREEAERLRIAREAIKKEKAELRAKKEAQRQLAEQYKEQMVVEKEAERTRNVDLYGNNQPTDEFWKYFGTSHR